MSKPRLLSTAIALSIPLLGFGCDGDSAPESAPRAPDAAVEQTVDAERDELGRLESLGYVTESAIEKPDLERDGVTIHDKGRAYKGINVFCSENSGIVRFMQMDGQPLLQVEVTVTNPWQPNNLCKLAELAGNDSLVMVVEGTELAKVGLDSEVEWRLRGSYHHDVDVSDFGEIYAILSVRDRVIPAFHPEVKILNDVFLVLSPSRETLQSYSLAAMVEHEPVLLKRVRRTVKKTLGNRKGSDLSHSLDLFHSNTVEVVRERVAVGPDLAFEKGDILFCARNLDTIGVIDAKRKRIKWQWGIGELEKPHHPSLLPDGRIMVFDNGFRRGYSRVIVVSPTDENIEWSYVADPPESFFSGSRGGAQMLPNGNVLITESDSGRVFEVTPDGTIVWEFWNERIGSGREARATIYRMSRLTREQIGRLALDEEQQTTLQDNGYL